MILQRHCIAQYNPRLAKRALPSGHKCSIGMAAGKTAISNIKGVIDRF